MSKPEDILDNLMKEKYYDIKKKYKQFCFLNGLTYEDDVLNDTYIKVKQIILKKGLKDETEKGIEDYFFKAFKKNTYMNFQQKNKSKLLYNEEIIEDMKQIKISDNLNDRIENERFDEFVKNYILNVISLKFDSLSTRVWRLKKLVTINQKALTYEQVRQMTHILDAKKRVIAIDKWLKQNLNMKTIYQEFNKIN